MVNIVKNSSLNKKYVFRFFKIEIGECLFFLLVALIISFLLLTTTSVVAQNNNLKKHFISVLQTENYLDSLLIIPQSVKLYVNDSLVNDSCFKINGVKGILYINDSTLLGLSGFVTYSTASISLQRSFYHKDPKLIMPDRQGMYNPFIMSFEQLNKKDDFFNDGLNKNGSISRGVSFGNNQNVVLNSGLNLQLSGKLTDKITVLAAVTDDNIPFQPQGNTQQLQEFDKVYIQLSDEKNKLIAGDFVLNKPESYFMTYYKRAQGLNFYTATPITKHTTVSAMLAAAVSKGKFARNIIQGVEGNQGPYRLKGAENELFIVVLSGTERVYIDGQLLTRGQENDYVIDYNTAEVTFTAKRLITKDRRIIVEFQYSDKNYARSLVAQTTNLQTAKNRLIVNYYNEGDNKNRPLQQNLNEQRKLILFNAGDDFTKAIAPAVDSVGFRNDLVLYAKKDTMVNEVHYPSVYYYSVNPDSAIYQLSFSFVGQNKGNYIQTASVVNGRVFKWVAPINGIPQGNYEPLVLLVTPKRKQMLDVNFRHQADSNFFISTEVAASNYDQNTFSPFDDKNNSDIAIKVHTENKYDLPFSNSGHQLITGLIYEQLNKNFAPIERFRTVEFERDWNLLSHTQKDNQYMGGIIVGIEKKRWGRIEWINQGFEEVNQISAKQSKINSSISTNVWRVTHMASVTLNKNTLSNDFFIRQRGTITRRIKLIQVSLKVDQEKNLQRAKNKIDSLLKSSYQFSEWFLTIANADTTGNRYSSTYSQRYDWILRNNKLQKSAFAQSIAASVELVDNKLFTLKTYSTYRQLKILDSMLLALQKPENNLLNRIENGFRFFNNAITTNTFYETNSGLELKKEYSYIQVAPGQGIYAWIDYNGNGVKELNEFEITSFSDQAQYIKVFTPTNSYIKVYGNQFNQVVNINPSAAIKSKSVGAKIINYWRNQFSYRIDRKTSGTSLQEQYNPFYKNTDDVSLQSLNQNFRNTLFFNSTGYVFGADYTYQENNSKLLLVNGFETRNALSHIIRTRYTISKYFIVNTEVVKGSKSTSSLLLTNRNYRLLLLEAEPKLTFQLGSEFRWSLSYRYINKRNTWIGDSTYGLIHKYTVELKLNKANKGSWIGKFSYHEINFSGIENTPVGYEILEGMRAGKNFTWNFGYQQNVSDNLQLTISYEGRKSPLIKVIHIGNITVRAIF